MPSGKCRGCGKTTNSATSNWWLHGLLPKSYFTNYPKEEGFSTECYLAWDENGTPVRGCGYSMCDPYMKKYVDDFIKKGSL